MGVEHIETSPQFNKAYRKLSKKIKEVAKEKEVIFRTNPYHPSLDTHKLHGKDADAWSFSINRRYRIKFMFVGNKAVLFLMVGTHDEVYR